MNAITIERLAGGNLIITAPGTEPIRVEAHPTAVGIVSDAMLKLEPNDWSGTFTTIPDRLRNQGDMIQRFADALGCPASDHEILSAIGKLKRDKGDLQTILGCARAAAGCRGKPQSLQEAITELARCKADYENELIALRGISAERDQAGRITKIIARNTVEGPGRDITVIFEPGSTSIIDGLLEALRQAEGPGQEFRAVLGLAYRVRLLGEELERYRAGKLNPAEVHNLCHKLDKTVSAEEFCAGCEHYQTELYGRSPITDLRFQLEAATELIRQYRAHGVPENFSDPQAATPKRLPLFCENCKTLSHDTHDYGNRLLGQHKILCLGCASHALSELDWRRKQHENIVITLNPGEQNPFTPKEIMAIREAVAQAVERTMPGLPEKPGVTVSRR